MIPLAVPANLGAMSIGTDQIGPDRQLKAEERPAEAGGEDKTFSKMKMGTRKRSDEIRLKTITLRRAIVRLPVFL